MLPQMSKPQTFDNWQLVILQAWQNSNKFSISIVHIVFNKKHENHQTVDHVDTNMETVFWNEMKFLIK